MSSAEDLSPIEVAGVAPPPVNATPTVQEEDDGVWTKVSTQHPRPPCYAPQRDRVWRLLSPSSLSPPVSPSPSSTYIALARPFFLRFALQRVKATMDTVYFACEELSLPLFIRKLRQCSNNALLRYYTVAISLDLPEKGKCEVRD